MDEVDIAFWGAALQIAPVLALALVFEARLDSRKWSEEWTPPAVRIIGVILHLTTSGLLVASFCVALAAFLGSPMGPEQRQLVGTLLALAFGLVALGPVLGALAVGALFGAKKPEAG